MYSLKFAEVSYGYLHLWLYFRHERPTDPDDPLADQNIKDRFYGTNDPVADKLMRRADTMPKLEPPDDKTVTTLYVGGLGDKVTEENLRYALSVYSRRCESPTNLRRQGSVIKAVIEKNVVFNKRRCTYIWD